MLPGVVRVLVPRVPAPLVAPLVALLEAVVGLRQLSVQVVVVVVDMAAPLVVIGARPRLPLGVLVPRLLVAPLVPVAGLLAPLTMMPKKTKRKVDAKSIKR